VQGIPRHELILDTLSKSTIELTIEGWHHSNPCVLHVGKLDHVLVHMLVILLLSVRRAHSEAWARSGCPKKMFNCSTNSLQSLQIEGSGLEQGWAATRA